MTMHREKDSKYMNKYRSKDNKYSAHDGDGPQCILECTRGPRWRRRQYPIIRDVTTWRHVSLSR